MTYTPVTPAGTPVIELESKTEKEAWAFYWPRMGENYTIKQFLLEASTEYIARKLTPHPEKVIDFESVAKAIDEDEVCLETLWVYEQKLAEAFGDDWYNGELPEIPNHKYQYVCKIVEAVKSGIRELAND